MTKEKKIIIDSIPSNFKWTYAELRKQIKEQLPYLQYRTFEKFKQYFKYKYKNKYVHERIHNPRSKNSQRTYYYDPRILEEFKKFYPPIAPSNHHIVSQIETLVDKILSKKKEDPQADTSESENQIDQLV